MKKKRIIATKRFTSRRKIKKILKSRVIIFLLDGCTWKNVIRMTKKLVRKFKSTDFEYSLFCMKESNRRANEMNYKMNDYEYDI